MADQLPVLRLDAPREEVLEQAAGVVRAAWQSFDRARPGQPGLDDVVRRLLDLPLPQSPSPLVAALLDWRKAERIATTYGYTWLDEHLGHDGRLRGAWTGSDGAAGRMTASSGLHNMPAVLRQAVLAAHGHLFVRADLGQIEPRVCEK